MSILRPFPPVPTPSASQTSRPLEPDAGAFQGMLQHVPCMDLPCDGDFAQANGVELPIVAINLAHRPDRLQALSRRMAAVGLTRLIRAPAVEGARLPAEQVAALLRSPADATDGGPRSHLTLTPPAVGCFLSHLGIWRWMLRMGLPKLLVVEDDANPVAEFSADRLRKVLARMAEETELVFLGCSIMGGLADKPLSGDLARLYYFNGTHAYLITPAACEFLLRHLLPIYAHVDHQISGVLMQQRHVFPAYYAAPLFFDPDWSLGSDCYVPLSDNSAADRELGQIITASRQTLLEECRPLLPEFPE